MIIFPRCSDVSYISILLVILRFSLVWLFDVRPHIVFVISSTVGPVLIARKTGISNCKFF